jgi:hypothetical protein
MILDVNEFAKDSLSTCQVGEKTHKIGRVFLGRSSGPGQK